MMEDDRLGQQDGGGAWAARWQRGQGRLGPLVFWALVSEPGFLKFQILRFSIIDNFVLGKYVWKICW